MKHTVASLAALVGTIAEATAQNSADIAAMNTSLKAMLARVEADAPAKTPRKAPAAPKAPKAAAPAPEGRLMTRTVLRDLKRTKKGKALAGVSMDDLRTGVVALPAGYRLPSGERRDAIRAWKAAQA